jgi:predicted nicotinamide N-methyase
MSMTISPLIISGAGCGLTSLVLSLCGYSVTATDKPDILPLLQRNINLNHLQLSSGLAHDITVKAFDWKDSHSMDLMAHIFPAPSPDLILLSDCFYQSDSVTQLWKLIAQVEVSFISSLSSLALLLSLRSHRGTLFSS